MEHETIGLLVNHKLERLWKKGVMTYYKLWSQNLPRGTEENNKNLRMASPQAKTWMWGPPQMKQKCWQLDHDIWYIEGLRVTSPSCTSDVISTLAFVMILKMFLHCNK